MTSADETKKALPGAGGLSWLLGAALLAAVVVAAVHYTDQRAFFRLLRDAEPWWVAVAVLLQTATYLAQGGIWRRVASACGYALGRGPAFDLSLAKLFADQAIPSAGLSSSILVAKALEQRQVPPPAVKASVLVDIVSYHLAYAIALSAALVIVVARGQGNVAIVVTSLLVLAVCLGLSAAVLALVGRSHERLAAAVPKVPAVHKGLEFVAGADPRLVRSPRVLGETIALQESIFLLDAGTVWFLILALGQRASVAGVFASFMVATLFRTMGVVPGGLGTFEATSVLTLRMVGVDVGLALSATLLFRSLSFWLPMLPGYWLSRRALAEPRVPRGAAAPPRTVRSIPPRSAGASRPIPTGRDVRQDQSGIHGR
ncbi:MAG TPA: lysylphosphatidylglycerol synthase transmembrane domain-containing protein [Vicinamibacteria bacterium]|nr:lysylphosphatidylglycerol synthase transmembrane domain-containing protein [Vicinamibacteria bacterium]